MAASKDEGKPSKRQTKTYTVLQLATGMSSEDLVKASNEGHRIFIEVGTTPAHRRRSAVKAVTEEDGAFAAIPDFVVEHRKRTMKPVDEFEAV